MSTIFLDPVAMDATARAVGEHAREVEDLASTLETACRAEVPSHLEQWLSHELHDITVNARLSALLYNLAALDTARRAQQIAADQSLATAWPPLDAPLIDATTSMTIGGDDSLTFPVSVPTPTSMTIGGDDSLTFPVSVPTPMTIGGDTSHIFPMSIPTPMSMIVGGTGLYGSSDSPSSVTMVIPPIDLDAFSGLSPSDLAAVTGILDTIHHAAAIWMAPDSGVRT
jgi:hypothetical protein